VGRSVLPTLEIKRSVRERRSDDTAESDNREHKTSEESGANNTRRINETRLAYKSSDNNKEKTSKESGANSTKNSRTRVSFDDETVINETVPKDREVKKTQ
jgi:hypothetical protein